MWRKFEVENNINTDNKKIDPIGLEILISIIDTVVTTIGVLHQFRTESHNRVVAKTFSDLQMQILHLQNSLDDFILTIDRFSNLNPENNFLGRKLSIRNTLIELELKDYLRFMEITSKIQSINQRVFKLASSLREKMLSENLQINLNYSDEDFLGKLDEIVLNMGNKTFTEFTNELREFLGIVNNILADKKYI